MFVDKQGALETEAAHDDTARRLLTQQVSHVRSSFGSALVHFGYDPGRRDLTLLDLVARWREVMAGDPFDSFAHDGWINCICDEMYRAIRYAPLHPRWELMKSRLYGTGWLYPILNHARLMSDGGFEFDIYLYRVFGELPHGGGSS